jgi:hypothetical protein
MPSTSRSRREEQRPEPEGGYRPRFLGGYCTLGPFADPGGKASEHRAYELLDHGAEQLRAIAHVGGHNAQQLRLAVELLTSGKRFARMLLYSPQRETIGSGAHFGQVAAPIGSPPKNSAILTGPADCELSYTTALSASKIACATSRHNRW